MAAACFFITGILLLRSITLQANGQLRNRQTLELAKQVKLTDASELLQSLEQTLKNHECYWCNYGNMLFAFKNYDQPIEKFETAKKITSNPNLFIQTGNCYNAINDFDASQKKYTIAKNILPNRMAPDSLHYWTLKPGLDPQVESIRINPGNYEDNGLVNPISETDPCNTGYVELCGIYVEPDSLNPKRPCFNEKVNSDIYEALRRNHFLEKKVFYKDL